MTGDLALQPGPIQVALPLWILMLGLAPVVGSFLAVVARRLGNGKSLIWARSVCESCDAAIAPYDLVPLLSFLALKGRCRRCGTRIALFHPAVEVAAIFIVLWGMTEGGAAWLVVSCLLGWTLLGLALCDVMSHRLPDGLTLPLLLAGLCVTAVFQTAAMADHALAAALAYALFRLIGGLYRHFRGVIGLGQGDAKLLAAAGAWLGLFALPDLILIAAASALVWALLLKAVGRAIDARTRLPFGPFLAMAAWLLWLYGPQMSLNYHLTYWRF